MIYLYCVSENEPNIARSFCDSELIVREVAGLYVVMKYVSADDYSDAQMKINLADEVWLESHARAHLEVIVEIMKSHTVIPFNFGTLYNSEAGVRKFFDDYSDELFSNIRVLDGKEEWALKVYCDQNLLIQNVEFISTEISDIDSEIQRSSIGKAYLLKKRKSVMIERVMTELYNRFSEEIFNRLNFFSEKFRFNSIILSDKSGANLDMILNVSFLLKNENIVHFLEIADIISLEHEKAGIIIDLTGPWPPYSFINMLLKHAG